MKISSDQVLLKKLALARVSVERENKKARGKKKKPTKGT